MRNASRMMVKEKIDEPMITARARVQSTCSTIAVAPETANESMTTRRAASVMGTCADSAIEAWPCTPAAISSKLVGEGRERTNRRVTRIATASDMSKLAATQLVARTPAMGRKMKPAAKEPATAPNRLTAYRVPSRRLTRPSSNGRATK